MDNYQLIPVGRMVNLGSVTSTGMKSFNHVTVGSGFPVALQTIVALRSFSTAFRDGLSTIRGYPDGTTSVQK